MQKDYRKFTVGELLDMGLEVEVKKHWVTDEQAKIITNMFEGAKQSTHKINSDLTVRKAWDKKFEVTCYLNGAD